VSEYSVRVWSGYGQGKTLLNLLMVNDSRVVRVERLNKRRALCMQRVA
jgi:hypothetical protein